uniref:acetyl-CoA C-acyltransferase n=1 Tax=Eucampia antarctica TaxID=49252 RepID=A0A7S2W0E2_9STRA|mmetsp:Transcript_15849/g.15246  ORF Transcript_15849/g.15246 Transcript_15849/m.15246 type:complete len:391 (+) Transcript_15849:70-1242(+)|eukprot:CAMPEP_0197824202 /NCGR_PEP_ID=MMETSP1437-20131217/1497_1 /TAXON_ID=49252 ORGANISM="Eucampia antarctica, Strain CCMP1452" /NCGR_SAMPLE_ID=MMETSP1437 /ASSEMBLY_ACC=CAM_ASM_001096 /LENGTH=390 /DNA_ID=CAMNT_0043423745 /DNA_START=41 /DNA_END=1213 /DNA_ORIENTATION=-
MERKARDVVIVSAVRTPLCRARKGGLSDVPVSTLLATALKGCLEKVCVEGSAVEDVCVGSVLCPASGAATMRMAQLSAGIPWSTSLQVVNRQCSSGLQAVASIANGIMAGDIDVGIGAGVESMSSHPMNKMPMPDVDWDIMKSCSDAMDCITPMGVTSENISRKYGLTRLQLDSFAALSHVKAARAQSDGRFQAEIVPVGNVSQDDGIRPSTTVDTLAKLKPVFDKEHGSTTAGNSSQLTDGAAAVLLMTRQQAMQRKLPILGVWRSFAIKGVPPKIMGIGPAVAIPAALQKVSLNTNDIDVFEINEAFASQASWCINELNIPLEKVNPNGGAIALGHPLGCTGARQIATLLHHMNRDTSKNRFGVVSMCIGTGMGAAAVLEVEPPSSSL